MQWGCWDGQVAWRKCWDGTAFTRASSALGRCGAELARSNAVARPGGAAAPELGTGKSRAGFAPRGAGKEAGGAAPAARVLPAACAGEGAGAAVGVGVETRPSNSWSSGAPPCNFIRKEFQFKKLLAMKFTTRML